MISDVNAYKDYLMMVNATPVLVRMVRESQMEPREALILAYLSRYGKLA